MKKCPECGRNYNDDSMSFCLDDGSELLFGPASFESGKTAILPSFSSPFEAGTLFQAPIDFLSGPPENTVAVLPFNNIGSDPDLEYFSDGLAEELLNVLSKIQGLRVAARTSAFSFKGKAVTVAEVGSALNVASVLEGSLRMSGKRIRIAVQLIKVQDGYQLWSETYDRTIDDIFAVQDDIAQAVVNEIRSLLIGEAAPSEIGTQILRDVAEATKGRSANPEAQRLMLLGRHFLDRTNFESSERAVEYLQQAVEIDPEFALGFAELARVHAVRAGKGWAPIDEGFGLARKAVDRALELDPELAEALAIHGRIVCAYEFDMRKGREIYARALELEPNNSIVLDGSSIVEYKLGHFERAIQLAKKILEIDPLNAPVWHNLGLMYRATDELAESEKAFRTSLHVSPERTVTCGILSIVLIESGRTDEALEMVEQEKDEFWRLVSYVMIYFRSGQIERSDEIMTAILENHTEGNSYQIAEAYAYRGEIDPAFYWLDVAINERDPGSTHALASPPLRLLHNDPRWIIFLKRIGLDFEGV